MSTILVLCVLLSNGCTTYKSKWSAAGRFPETGDLLDGRWEGSWLSDRNGHSGRLRCIMTKQGENTYEASFQATYFGVLLFHYPVTLQTSGTESNVMFSGEANLGWWAGGLYRYAGQADQVNFFCTYTNKYDYGTFKMTRQ